MFGLFNNGNSISVEELKQKLKDKDFKLIDVRAASPDPIPGTDLHIPLDQLTEIAEHLPDKSKKLVIYCNSGNTSKLGVKILQGMGYEDVVDLDGGIIAWYG